MGMLMFVKFGMIYVDHSRRRILDIQDGMKWSALLHCSTIALIGFLSAPHHECEFVSIVEGFFCTKLKGLVILPPIDEWGADLVANHGHIFCPHFEGIALPMTTCLY